METNLHEANARRSSAPSPDANRASPVQAWLQLVRAPNLLTVPGDPVAGYLLTAAVHPVRVPALILIAAASLAFYMAGLLQNDCVDFREDSVDRPGRPLPSGRASKSHVAIAAGFLFAVALALCAAIGIRTLGVGLILLGAILMYNLSSRKTGAWGVMNMGLCRGLNVLLGVSAAYPEAPSLLPGFMAAGLISAYIVAVTALARNETRPTRVGVEGWIPAFVLTVGFAAFIPLAFSSSAAQRTLAMAVYGMALLISTGVAIRIARVQVPQNRERAHAPADEGMMPRFIGMLISSLIFIQAAFILVSGESLLIRVLGLGLAAAWPANRLLSKVFYAS